MICSVMIICLLRCQCGLEIATCALCPPQSQSEAGKSSEQSRLAKEPVVVPTLSSGVSEGRNVVWCATFQLAWDQLVLQFQSSPKVKGSEELSSLLNKSTFPKDQLPVGVGYSIAGRSDKGILRTIERDMKQAFPSVTLNLNQESQGWVAYAYMGANTAFAQPFLETATEFNSSDGRKDSVVGFGISEKESYDYPKLRSQIDLLYYDSPDGSQKEFVLDPCNDSRPFQIILAKTNRKGTLAEKWSDVESKITHPKKNHALGFGGNDIFLCPNLKVFVQKRFSELEGKPLIDSTSAIPGPTIDTARQSIDFVLDRGGAEVKSEAMIRLSSLPRKFLLDGPFLVILRKRGGNEPCFALWVDNSGIMTRKQ